MFRMIRRSVALGLLVLILLGCAKSDPKVQDGLGGFVDREQAITIAQRETPLRTIDRVVASDELPYQHRILGWDESGRYLIAWVNTDVIAYAYDDELITPEEALRVAVAAGLATEPAVGVSLGHTFEPEPRVYWSFSHGPHFVWVDARNREILRTNLSEGQPLFQP